MTEQENYSEWVDRYVRDELSDQEAVDFEERLLEDPGLQRELEAVLAIRKALTLDAELPSESVQWANTKPVANRWSSMAIAASVVLAIVSTMFYWRTSIEAGRLQERLTALQTPRTEVLNVPVNIMRTAGDASPDAIVQVPAGNGVIVLDIELSSQFQNLASINFQLQANDIERVLKWTAPPLSSGRARVVLFSETIPDGQVSLQISNPSGDLTESRLLEFRRTQP